MTECHKSVPDYPQDEKSLGIKFRYLTRNGKRHGFKYYQRKGSLEFMLCNFTYSNSPNLDLADSNFAILPLAIC